MGDFSTNSIKPFMEKNILIVSFKISSFKLISCFLSLILLSDRTNCSSMLWLIFFFHLVLLIFVVTLGKTWKIKLFLPWFTCLSHSKDFERDLGNILFALENNCLPSSLKFTFCQGFQQLNNYGSEISIHEYASREKGGKWTLLCKSIR